MIDAKLMAERAERAAADGNMDFAVRLQRILGHAERVTKLAPEVVSDAEREVALYRIWAAYANVQERVTKTDSEYRTTNTMPWDIYAAELDAL
jgi:hypothetical protein